MTTETLPRNNGPGPPIAAAAIPVKKNTRKPFFIILIGFHTIRPVAAASLRAKEG
jgi:hypothetical protein